MSARRAVALVVALSGALLLPSAAVADTTTMDFESGPPVGTAITNEYQASAFTFFQLSDFGFRPYRKAAAGLAHSGTTVANVGPDLCGPAEGSQG